ncbi:bifunctional adenosylcobinamide kinase/adenosylcobinamide-phosphate guanylyltransferase [Amantichitinum ursilacus]|uniref:Bifunctional adenosylcobalamin biosynthesis protein n=1 Tax=Amantichitinum ursilacus TaxID=857265 RepID=A0A0N0GL91_9NEIS|nr:bifunctional adenosylcobinamide kinase/adenosylcobinamide-phosphate guanylyltransferase [Amantichitinum ursilacus]KPC49697.1 Bifunctional adenosylcobalamin biosynthesis protein CobP [Amantichitinum ursilacus]
MQKTLLLGGARSGKSALAETIALRSGRRVTYIATAQIAADDTEMALRIAHHQARRPAQWHTLEPLDLPSAISAECIPGGLVLVDCLTVWLAQQLFPPTEISADEGRYQVPADWQRERERLLEAIARAHGDLVLVSNEVGQGIVPMGAGNRAYVDHAGWLHQAVAQRCDNVLWVAAGLALPLKGVNPAAMAV